MCVSNYWQDNVETVHDHVWDREYDLKRLERRKRKLGLKGDVPDWLLWRMESNPPSDVNRMGRRAYRTRLREAFREATRPGADLDDVSFETRMSRLDRVRSAWW